MSEPTLQQTIDTILDTSKSNRERGDILVKWAAKHIDQFMQTIWRRITKNSGAVHGDGDIQFREIMLDGKVKGKCTSISVKRSEMDKVRMQAAKHGKTGGILSPIIDQDKELHLYITMEWTDVLFLIAETSGALEPEDTSANQDASHTEQTSCPQCEGTGVIGGGPHTGSCGLCGGKGTV